MSAWGVSWGGSWGDSWGPTISGQWRVRHLGLGLGLMYIPQPVSALA